jgi:hypothetical protein
MIKSFMLVGLYNIILFAGASYLIVAHDFSAWTYLIVLMLAASLRKDKEQISEEDRQKLMAMFFESFALGHRCGRVNDDVRKEFDELEYKFREQLKEKSN